MANVTTTTQPNRDVKSKDPLLEATLGKKPSTTNRRLADGGVALILDVSASMNGWLNTIDGHTTKIAQLVKLTQQICDNVGEDFPCYTFGTDCIRIAPRYVDTTTRGTTDLAAAFEMVYKCGQHRAVLITDGQPDDADSALTAAQKFDDLEVIYVGPPPPPEFLIQLAALFSHPLHENDLGEIKEIEHKVVALLEAKPKELPSSGAIQLG